MATTWIEPLTLTVAKGATIQIGEHEWKRVRYELQMNVTGALNKDDLDHARDLAEKMIDAWISKQSNWQPSPEATKHAHELAQIPDIDIADVLQLPWKDRHKKPAKDGLWGWILSDKDKYEGLERTIVVRLSDAIRKSKGSFELGQYKYEFSGAQGQYINRKPVKRESAR